MEDAYTYYVHVLGISESVFWGMDLAGLASIAANQTAYDSWLTGERIYAQKEAAKRNRR